MNRGFYIILIVFLGFGSCTETEITPYLPENPDTVSEAQPRKFLALGDMYTIGTKVDSVQRWPKQLVDSLRKRDVKISEPDILASRYWTADDLDKGLSESNRTTYDLVSIMIGVNDQWYGTDKDEFTESFRNVITHAMKRTQEDVSKIVIFSIPDYGYTPFNSRKREFISSDIKIFNGIIKEMADDYGIKYVDIVPLSKLAATNRDFIQDDGFHYTPAFYTLWVEFMLNEHNFFNTQNK